MCALVVGYGLIGTGSAEASCSHYVKRLGPGFVPGKAAAAQVEAQSLAEAIAHESHSGSVPCGCHGPECRRAPETPVPLSPKAPLRLLSQQDLAPLAAADDLDGMNVGWHVGAASPHPASGYPLAVARPPAA